MWGQQISILQSVKNAIRYIHKRKEAIMPEKEPNTVTGQSGLVYKNFNNEDKEFGDKLGPVVDNNNEEKEPF